MSVTTLDRTTAVGATNTPTTSASCLRNSGMSISYNAI